MADSEISRTLPAITPGKTDVDDGAIKNLPYQIDRRNLLPVAARLLSARIAESAGKRRERAVPRLSENCGPDGMRTIITAPDPLVSEKSLLRICCKQPADCRFLSWKELETTAPSRFAHLPP